MIGVVNQSVHSLVVKKWKWVIKSKSPLRTNVLHLTLCFYWSSSALGLQLHPLIPSPVPSPSPANFPPPLSPSPFPLLPSSVCFCSLDSLSVPTSTLSLSNYSPSLSLLCLLDCKRETLETKVRKGKQGGWRSIMLTSNSEANMIFSECKVMCLCATKHSNECCLVVKLASVKTQCGSLARHVQYL